MGTPDPGEGEQEQIVEKPLILVGLVPTVSAANVGFRGVRDAHTLQINLSFRRGGLRLWLC